MACSCSIAFKAHGAVQKPSISPSLNDLKPSLTTSVKPSLKELQNVLLKIDIYKAVKDTSKKILDAFVNSTFQFVDQQLLPSQRNFTPIKQMKSTVKITCIEGDIPAQFPNGVYIRNGPNPLFGGLKSTVSMFGRSNHTWFEGEGMLHALYMIKDSHGRWTISYKNRYVETETFKLENQRNKPCFIPAIEGNSPAILAAYLLNFLRFGNANKHISNTNVFEHSGKLYAGAENYLPQEIDIYTLETYGDWDIDGSWQGPFTSHPKKDPVTGELIIMGIAPVKPYFVLGVISADSKKLVHKMDLRLNRSIVCHEMGITEKYNVIMDSPLTFSLNRLVRGGPLIKYEKEEDAKIGVMPRYGDADSVQWFEVEPHITFHILNCFEDANEVVVRGCRALESIIPGPEISSNKFKWFSRGFKPVVPCEDQIKNDMEDGFLFTRLYEWRLNMESGEVKEKFLSGTDFPMDFPMINANFTGLKNKYGYTQVVDSTASSDCGMAKYGMLAKFSLSEPPEKPSEWKGNCESEEEGVMKVEYHKFENKCFCSGAAFVSNPEGSEEDDGWIMCFVHNEVTNESQVHIIDAKKFESDPVAKITLPQRVPYGFHGAFFSLETPI